MSSKGKRRAIAEINVVPYIDVMLVLLVIFMITAPIVQQGVKVKLPQAAANSLPPDVREPVILSVSKNGDYYLNIGNNLRKPVSDKEVLRRVRIVMRLHPETPVMVRGDTAVSYGSVTRAMVLLQRAGVEKVGLMTDSDKN